MKQNTITDIERAIETVRLFNENKRETTEGSLQKSLDLLKVYTSCVNSMQKGSDVEKLLARRILDTAKTYNEVVRRAKLPPATISDILKQFFLKIAGQQVDTSLMRDEIYIPVHMQYGREDTEGLAHHKITVQKESASGKILSALQSVQRSSDADYNTVKQPELDLFRTKTLTLLLTQNDFPITLKEALYLVQESEIICTLEEGAYLLQDNQVRFYQKITPFPGVEIESTGTFQRDTFHPDLVIPLKGSFQLRCSNFQTGFPHPSQYIGIALHEKLLPSCILRPKMCPKFEELIKQKHFLARELLPTGSLYCKAKRLLDAKKHIFSTNKELFTQLKSLIKAQNTCCGVQDHSVVTRFFQESPNWYEELSHKMATLSSQIYAAPIDYLQEEWLLKHNPNLLLKPYEEGFFLMLQAQETVKYKELGPYSPDVLDAFGKAGISLHLMQLSEHLNFEPKDLSPFDRTLLTSLFRQQLIFAHELQELEQKDLAAHIAEVVHQEISLFSDKPCNDIHTLKAQELTEELFQYYCVRFETESA